MKVILTREAQKGKAFQGTIRVEANARAVLLVAYQETALFGQEESQQADLDLKEGQNILVYGPNQAMVSLIYDANHFLVQDAQRCEVAGVQVEVLRQAALDIA